MIERLRAPSPPSRYLIFVAGARGACCGGRRRRGGCGRCRQAVRAGSDGLRWDQCTRRQQAGDDQRCQSHKRHDPRVVQRSQELRRYNQQGLFRPSRYGLEQPRRLHVYRRPEHKWGSERHRPRLTDLGSGKPWDCFLQTQHRCLVRGRGPKVGDLQPGSSSGALRSHLRGGRSASICEVRPPRPSREHRRELHLPRWSAY